MPPKTRKSTSLWLQCDKCSTNILQKDVEQHSKDCPPNLNDNNYSFVIDGKLYGQVSVKNNEDIKSITQHERDNMVFLSQSVIQLCSLSIGDWAEVRCMDLSKQPVAKIVWPTNEQSITSVLFTKNCLDLTFTKPEISIMVSRITKPIKEAWQVTLVILNGQKSLELTPELYTRIHKSHLDRLITTGNKISILFFGKLLKFEIKGVDPIDISGNKTSPNLNLIEEFRELSIDDYEFLKVTEKTNWKLYKDELEYKKEVTSKNIFEKIGGLDEEMDEVNDLIDAAFEKSVKTLKFKTCKGVLLYGNSGTGKTLLANTLAKSSKANIINVSATDLYTKYSGNAEEALKSLFQDAVQHAPTIIILDEVDILCPSRSTRMTDMEKRIVSSVLIFLDSLNDMEDCKIFILGTTNKLDAVDPAFRRCGRFDREIEIPTPNPLSRFDILKKLLSDIPYNIQDNVLKEIANSAHGFVGADLVSLCSRAALHASKLKKVEIEYEDFKFALTRVRPSAMREVQIEVPNVKWSDIGGQENLKLILKQAVEWPLKHAESFVRMGITPPRGVLMFGPPGCSKTMIAKALATESGLNFLSIKGPELFSKWVGESERAVREVFRKARQVAPSIIFFDEIDALGGERSTGSSTSVQERVLAQLLTELDGVTPLGDVTILAATNRPDRIDKALLRPGRLDRIVYVPLPNSETRREIFKLKLIKMPTLNVNINNLVTKTEDYSGAEVNAVCHEAAMAALEEDLNCSYVEMRHFEKALGIIAPRTSKSLIEMYKEYVKK